MKTLQMTLAIMMIASGIVVAPGLAQETSGLVLHMAPADYSGCAALPEPGLTCSDIEIIGDSSQPQYLFVSTFGFNDTNYPGWGGSADAGIGAVQFGISYDDAAITLLGSMVLCTGGAEIPQTDPIAWPAPNTGNAVTWAGACYESPARTISRWWATSPSPRTRPACSSFRATLVSSAARPLRTGWRSMTARPRSTGSVGRRRTRAPA